MRGIAFINALIRTLSSGTMETKRNTLNTLNRRAKSTPEPPVGIKLPTTIQVSKIFQPLLKNRFLSGQARYRIDISIAKKMVTAMSRKSKIAMVFAERLCVLTPINKADKTMTAITMP